MREGSHVVVQFGLERGKLLRPAWKLGTAEGRRLATRLQEEAEETYLTVRASSSASTGSRGAGGASASVNTSSSAACSSRPPAGA